jgi:F-type H+-transporting ATPase subunit a
MNLLLASSGEKHTALGHVLDKELIDVGIIGTVSMQVVTMIIGSILLLLIMPRVAKRISTGSSSQGNERYITKGRLSQLVEVICLYLRDAMLVPVMGEKDTRKYFPFLMTMFFFILMMNLLGLIPLPDIQNIIGKFGWGNDHFAVIGGTPTSNINITVGLAAISFVVIQIHSFRELGVLGFLEHMTCGLTKGPWFLWLVVPVIFVVELAGLFIKPGALAIRLFANMVGGHVLLATLLLFGADFYEVLPFGGLAGVTIVSGIAAILITFLEVFVAFLQAFIFMFLTAVFISLMSHHDEEHESHESHDAHGEGSDLQPAH